MKPANFTFWARLVLPLGLAALAGAWVCPAQESEEVVANLATGRVLINVSKDGIVVAAVQNQAERGAQAPAFLQIGARRVAILLGAVEWVLPSSGPEPIRMDAALQTVMKAAMGTQPGRLTDSQNDLEQIGLGLLEHLRQPVDRIHHKLELGEEEAILEVVLVGYIENYGAEVWTLSYRLKQDAVRGEFWRTRVLRPRYTQLYPPDKGEPRRLIEVRYPAEAGTPFLEMLDSDARLAAVREADSLTAAGLGGNESHKLQVVAVTEVLRPAMNIVAGPEAQQVLGVIEPDRGVEWALEPPDRTKKAEDKKKEKERPAGTPTLRKP